MIPKEKIPEGRKYVRSKWVFKITRNGIFRARLVRCGYSQVPAIDFTESYSSVIIDVSFRIMLIGMMVFNLKAKIIDIETAFLHNVIKEGIFMEISSGMEVGNGKVLS
jgi:hypothetical protein